MNKLLFLIITMLLFIILMFVSDYVAASYLLSDYYVPREDIEQTQDDEYLENAMPLDEYKQMIKNGEDPGIETPEQMPIEIQLLQAKSFLLRIFYLCHGDYFIDFRSIHHKKHAHRVFIYGVKLRRKGYKTPPA